MVKAECLEVFRDENYQVIGYTLQDMNGCIRDFNYEWVKNQMKASNLFVTNLRLLPDDTVIYDDTNEELILREAEGREKVSKLLQKAKLLNNEVREVPTGCDHTCYIITQTPDSHIVYIPDDVKQLNHSYTSTLFTYYVNKLHGHIKVTGGAYLKDTSLMFAECEADSLDILGLNTQNVKNMYKMFYKCKAKVLDFSALDTSNATELSLMFAYCNVDSLDLSKFDTHKAEDLTGMFCGCTGKYLDLSSFDIGKVNSIASMFDSAEIGLIDLSSFDTSEVGNIYLIFDEFKGKIKTTDSRLLSAYEVCAKSRR